MNSNYSQFSVNLYGELEKLSPVLSKGRCRIFYKYGNRNGSYISDEFAEKLISTLPYTPVKGIYDEESQDYTDHGTERDLGRIYGIVPENPNFAWETHLDEDGIQRVYACCDVYIFTAIYKEAAQISNKSQSMELYAPSIKGQWEYIDGQKYFKFEDGCFLGLQILGDETEPCFEGAAFFTLYNKLKEMVEQIEKYTVEFREEGGKSNMASLNFRLSDREKFDALWMLLNDKYNEENEWAITYGIQDIYEEYALAFNYETGSYERVYYTKDDEANVITITDRKECYIIDMPKEEYEALQMLKEYNNGTYANINEKFENIDTLKAENEEFSAKIEELNNNISTLTTERDENAQNFSIAQEKIDALTEEVNSLTAYKKEIEKQEKEQVLDSYSELLPSEVLESYTEEKLEQYNATELDKELAYELKKNHSEVFTNKPMFVPKDNVLKDGIESILDKYKK